MRWTSTQCQPGEWQAQRTPQHPAGNCCSNTLIERTHIYSNKCGGDLGERFFDTAMSTLDVVAERPEGGSLRIGELSGITDLPAELGELFD